MSEVLIVPPPKGILQRIGPRRHGGALAWPSLQWVKGPKDGSPAGGANRFDDPRGAHTEFTVLYASALRVACFAETLDPFRVRVDNSAFASAVQAIAPLSLEDDLNFDAEMPHRAAPDEPRPIPDYYFATKEIGSFEIVSAAPLLDVRRTATQTAEALSVDPDMTIRPIKPGDFVGDNRAKTQAMALWAYRTGCGGLLYTSSHELDESWACVALFPSTVIRPVGSPISIDRADPDLAAIARRFNLRP